MTPFTSIIAPTALRGLDGLSEKHATAILEFIVGSLADSPRRVGRPLGRELTGEWSARRGVYRVVYSIDDEARVVLVTRIDHRAKVYRPR